MPPAPTDYGGVSSLAPRSARVGITGLRCRQTFLLNLVEVQQGPWQTRRADPDTGEAMEEVQEVGEEEGDRLILVRSQGCAQKEKGIH
jgi:hypothetical protein